MMTYAWKNFGQNSIIFILQTIELFFQIINFKHTTLRQRILLQHAPQKPNKQIAKETNPNMNKMKPNGPGNVWKKNGNIMKDKFSLIKQSVKKLFFKNIS